MTRPSSDLSGSAPRTVEIRDGVFWIDGQSQLLLTADLPYGRIPPALWAARLAAASENGANTVELSVSEQRTLEDVARLEVLLTESAAAGLYAFVRFETGDAPAALASVLARHQWMAGGAVLLIETARDDDDARETLLRAGIEVPIRAASLREQLGARPTARDAERAAWHVWASGSAVGRRVVTIPVSGRPDAVTRAQRRVARFARSVRDILLHGKFTPELRSVRGGLCASETSTPQAGGIVWLENPETDRSIEGSLFPYLPSITLPPGGIFAYVHDAPVGRGANYLGAYAGLVKSDAEVLTAHILPDPHDGIRVYVYGEPGETREVAVWSGNEHGRGVDVAFIADTPEVYAAGMSQVVALPAYLAGRVWIDPSDDTAPALIGPDGVRDLGAVEAFVEIAPGRMHTLYALRADGAITVISVDAPPLPPPPILSEWYAVEPEWTTAGFDDSGWREIDDIFESGAIPVGLPTLCARARVHLPAGDGGDARLDVAGDSRLALWINGVLVAPPASGRGPAGATFDVSLRDGDNLLCLRAEDGSSLAGPVTLAPAGGCYLLDIARWRIAAAPADAPTGRYRATFTLAVIPDPAAPLVARFDAPGPSTVSLNGHVLPPPESGDSYYLPEPYLTLGENRLEIASPAPPAALLSWDDNASVLARIAL
jgi:hypothetical protein